MAIDARQFATCIEHEWGDVLFPSRTILAEEYLEDPDGSLNGILPSPFHRELARFTSRYLSAIRLETPKVVEIGGGAGRFAYEFLLHNGYAREYHYSDSEKEKVEFARWIFGDEGTPRPIPQLVSTFDLRHRMVQRPQLEEGILPAITIHHRTLESTEWTIADADLVVCLNVIDHVPNPAEFLAELRRLMKPGGLLLLASPMDWHEEMTRRELWSEDLKELLGGDWEILAERNFPYYWRSRLRRLIVFISQAVIVRAR